jgi:AraC-like DNA-binding protein
LTKQEKKQHNFLRLRLQSVLVYAAMLFCAILASVTASLLVERQYSNALRNDLFEKISDKASSMASDIEEVFDSALSMNMYALENNLYQQDDESDSKLNSYTLYTTLKYIQNYSPYFSVLSLYDEKSNLVYDSQAIVSRVENYFDSGVKILANQTKDQSINPLDRLAYYYRTAASFKGSLTQYNAMTAVLATRKGRHVLINVNLDRLYADFQKAVSEFCRVETVLSGNGTEMLLSGLESEQTKNVLTQTEFDGKIGKWFDARQKEYSVLKFSVPNAGLDFYAVISEATIQQMTRESIAEIQQVQILMFGVYLLLFTLLIFFLMRPLAKMLRATLAEDNGEKTVPVTSLSVKGMLQAVIDKNKELTKLREDTFPIYTANLLSSLLTEAITDPEQTARELESCGFHFEDGTYFTCAIEVGGYNDSPDEIQLRKQFIVKRCNEILEEGNGFAADLDGRVIGIACTARKGREQFFHLIENIRQMLLTKINMHTTIVISSGADDIMKLKSLFAEAVGALSYRVAFDEENIVDCEKFQISKGILQKYYQEMENEFNMKIRLGDAEKVEIILAELFNFIGEHRYELSVREIADVSIRILGKVVQILEECGAAASAVTEKSVYELYKTITASTKKELYELISRVSVAAACSIGVSESSLESRKNRTVKKICAYIDGNYAKDLSLDVVADYMNLNASYVSTVFKEVTEQSFSSYLEERRMEAAVSLIQTSNLKISQIAERVGYHSPNYFSKAFRKKMGVSPDQYRNLFDQKENDLRR